MAVTYVSAGEPQRRRQWLARWSFTLTPYQMTRRNSISALRALASF